MNPRPLSCKLSMLTFTPQKLYGLPLVKLLKFQINFLPNSTIINLKSLPFKNLHIYKINDYVLCMLATYSPKIVITYVALSWFIWTNKRFRDGSEKMREMHFFSTFSFLYICLFVWLMVIMHMPWITESLFIHNRVYFLI